MTVFDARQLPRPVKELGLCWSEFKELLGGSLELLSQPGSSNERLLHFQEKLGALMSGLIHMDRVVRGAMEAVTNQNGTTELLVKTAIDSAGITPEDIVSLVSQNLALKRRTKACQEYAEQLKGRLNPPESFRETPSVQVEETAPQVPQETPVEKVQEILPKAPSPDLPVLTDEELREKAKKQLCKSRKLQLLRKIQEVRPSWLIAWRAVMYESKGRPRVTARIFENGSLVGSFDTDASVNDVYNWMLFNELIPEVEKSKSPEEFLKEAPIPVVQDSSIEVVRMWRRPAKEPVNETQPLLQPPVSNHPEPQITLPELSKEPDIQGDPECP